MEQMTTKNFFQKPEGKTGAILGIAILAGIGVGLYKILPYLITLMQNMLYLTGMGIAAAALLYVLFDPTFRNNIWTMYKLVMRKMTGWVITIDPIAIQEMHVKTMKDKREEMNVHITNLNGSKTALDNKYKDYETMRLNALRLANEAQQQLATNPRMKNQLAFEKEEIGRYEDAKTEILPTQKVVHLLYDRMNELYDTSEWLIRDMESKIKLNKDKWNALQSAKKTINAAGKFFNNNDAETEMFNQSMEYQEQEMSNMIGNVEQFMRNTTSIMDNIDLQRGVMSAKGEEMLAEFQNMDYTTLLQPASVSKTGAISPDKILIPRSTGTVNLSKNTRTFDDDL